MNFLTSSSSCSPPIRSGRLRNLHVLLGFRRRRHGSGSGGSSRLGAIRGVRLDIDPAALGLPIAAWVRLRPTAGQMSRIVQLAQDCAEVSECHRISGEDCFLLKVHVRALNDLESVLDRFLVYGQTTSSLIVSTPVPPRPVLP